MGGIFGSPIVSATGRSRRLRVLLLTGGLYYGGAERQVVQLAKQKKAAKARGLGRTYPRGETWWIQYYDQGTLCRESSGLPRSAWRVESASSTDPDSRRRPA